MPVVSPRAKRLRNFLLIGCTLVVVAFGILTWLASSRLLCPARRQLQDYHREILGHAQEHGMRIESFVCGSTPCLLCEPISNPGAALKGNKLRTELQSAGLTLAPWGEIKATLVLLHGHSGCKEDHLPIAERFCAAGFRCLLPDLPGHGQHPAPFASFGKTENVLPSDVLREASLRFHFQPAPAALFGISQGGAIALQAAALEDARWIAVAELSSFASLDRIVRSQAEQWFGPFASIADGTVTRLIQARAGYGPAKIRPVDSIAKLRIPVFIGHGDADKFVAPEQAQLLYAAAATNPQRAPFFNVAGAGHSNVLVTSAPVYASLSTFFLEALSAPATKL
jgi:pimeloyl-ACP methyl ester carboxylesterase